MYTYTHTPIYMCVCVCAESYYDKQLIENVFNSYHTCNSYDISSNSSSNTFYKI